jgi:hypothetical protein
MGAPAVQPFRAMFQTREMRDLCLIYGLHDPIIRSTSFAASKKHFGVEVAHSDCPKSAGPANDVHMFTSCMQV